MHARCCTAARSWCELTKGTLTSHRAVRHVLNDQLRQLITIDISIVNCCFNCNLRWQSGGTGKCRCIPDAAFMAEQLHSMLNGTAQLSPPSTVHSVDVGLQFFDHGNGYM